MASIDFSFFPLPAEIRVKIDSHLLVYYVSSTRYGRTKKEKALIWVCHIYPPFEEKDFGKIEVRLDGPQFQHAHELGLSAQLLRTCKLIHNESAPILYGQHRFAGCSYYTALATFLDNIGPRHASYITDLELYIPRLLNFKVCGDEFDTDLIKQISGKCGARVGEHIRYIRTVYCRGYPEMANFASAPGSKQLKLFETAHRFFEELFPEVEVLSAPVGIKACEDKEHCEKIRQIGWTLDW